MQFIIGRVVIVENNQIIRKDNYEFSSVIFVIKKRMNGKIRNIAFECIGKLADQVLKLRRDDKVEVKYLISSSYRKGRWFTNLHAKEIFKFEEKTKEAKNNNQFQLNIDYDNKVKKSFEG